MSGKTSHEIARICGVSRGTVDRALNNRPGIKPATKEKILKVAKELNYRPDFLGQSLVKGTTMTLGIIVFDINNRIFSQLIHVMEKQARARGYSIYLTFTDKQSEIEIECIDQMVSRKVDAIIMMSVNIGGEFEAYLKSLPIPVVTFANRISDEFPYVWIHDRKAIYDAVHYIVSCGYEHLIYISPPLGIRRHTNLYTIKERYQGLLEASAELPRLSYEVIRQHDYIPKLQQLLGRRKEKRWHESH